MTGKAIGGIAIIIGVMALWVGSSWYAIALGLDILGVTGTLATVLTVIGVGIAAVLAGAVMKLAGSVLFGKGDRS